MTKLTKSQQVTRKARWTGDDGVLFTLYAKARHDDSCGNGHNTFAITGELFRKAKNGRQVFDSCGMLHDDIAKHIPEWAPLLKWHLCSTDGPMHYLANTTWLAGDCDHNGFLKDEVSRVETRIRFGDNPILHGFKPTFVNWLETIPAEHSTRVVAVHHDNKPGDSFKFKPKYTFNGYPCEWHECPFNTQADAENFREALNRCNPQFVSVPVAWGEGKEPDLEAARSTAIWPDATLDQLRDKDTLTTRLPALLDEFRAAVESLGMEY